MKYSLVPFGCQMNISDSERVRSVLESLGYERTDVEQEADILGIVACSVRQKAIDKVYTRIHKWNTWKAERPLVTFLSGCVLPADREKFADRFDLMFTINELPHLPEMLRHHGVVTPASIRAAEASAFAGNAATDTPPDPRTDYWHVTPHYSSEFEAYIPIQNGCNKFCTYCAVPYTRGREVSRPSDEILDELRRLVNAGYRSITLLGQNVNSYGLDRRGAELTFPALMEEIGRIGNSLPRRTDGGPPFWLYFTSPHPHDMTDELIDAIAQYDCLAKQIHLPIQSGDDEVLRRMRRNYDVDRYRKIMEKIRSSIPTATVFTDIIVGFTGETDEQFENTRTVLREFHFNMAYIAMYSPRPGATSAKWEDDVPHEEKRRRLHELSRELREMSQTLNNVLIGSEHVILVDGRDRKAGYLTGKTEGRLIVRFRSDSEDLVGQWVRIRITAAAALSLEGELVDVIGPGVAAAD